LKEGLKMMKKIMLLLILGMAVFLCSTAFAHFWNGKGKGKECPVSIKKEHCQCPIMEKFMKKARFLLEYKSDIGLTDDQAKTLKELKLQMEKDSIRQSADMKTFLLDLKSKLAEDKVDVEGANALIDENFASVSAAAKSNLATYAKLKSLLTPDQMTKMKALHEQMEKKEKEEEKNK
jgi:flagellar basal body-associated protein FliL